MRTALNRKVHSMKVALLIIAGLVTVEDHSRASDYNKSLFARALREDSTSPLFVLVTIQDGNTGNSREVCMEAPLLLWAIAAERQLSYEPASLTNLRHIAISQPDRSFTFASSTVLERVK